MIAGIIFGGIPAITLAGYGVRNIVRRSLKRRHERQVAAAPWKPCKYVDPNGTILVVVERRLKHLMIEQRKVDDPLPASAHSVDVDVLMWEAQRRALIYNEGRA